MQTILFIAVGFVACLGVLGMQYLVCWFAYTRFVQRENKRTGEIIRAFDPRSRAEQARIAEGKAFVDDGTTDMAEGVDAVRKERSNRWHQPSRSPRQPAAGG